MLNAEWDDRPADYAQTRDCWLTRRRLRYMTEIVGALPAGARVLEIGSGAGEVLITLSTAHPRLQFVGLEPQASYVAFASEAASRQRAPNASFREGSAEEADVAFAGDPGFDLIVSNDVLHHVASQERAAAAAAHVARPGARWLAIEPNWRNVYVLVRCAWKRGEKNFWPAPFLKAARRAGWTGGRRSFLFLVPPFVKEPSPFFVRLEERFETQPLLAGGVALLLEKA
ncbi:MAG: class I SAM-dependent methyltransferase [Thermoanaerobaculia bacterium]